MGNPIVPIWFWTLLWVTLFIYLVALALKKTVIINAIGTAGKFVGAIVVFLVLIALLFGKSTSEGQGFILF